MKGRGLSAQAVMALAGAVAGCVAPPVAQEWPEPRPLGRELTAYRAPADPAAWAAASEAARPEEGKAELTLRDALARALMHHPELRAFAWDIRAAEARRLQASLRPNPEVELEVEEIAGEGERSGLDAAEAALALSQTIELGGKRLKRTRAAALEAAAAAWDYEAKRLDVLTETAKAFIELVAAQERVALDEELLRLAEEALRTVQERVRAGKEAPLEENKATVTMAESRIVLAKARGELAAARKRLAALWGGDAPAFDKAVGQLDALAPLPSPAALAAALAESPDLARWATETQLRRAKLELEQANGRPDLTVSGGVQWFNETDEGAFVLGLSVPLPLFDRNQGGVLEAQAELARAAEEKRAAAAAAHAALADAWQALTSAAEEAASLKQDVLPAAQAAFALAREGYRQGKFGYLEVLDAQRTLFEARGQLLDALAAYHRAVADLERLVGQPLGSLNRK